MTDAPTRAALAQRLRDQAQALLADTGLFSLLESRFGEPSVTGSASYDLMVRRQVDIHMPADAERLPEWAGLAADLAAQFSASGFELNAAMFRNDYIEPTPIGAGLYWGLAFRDRDGSLWQVALWGWDPFDHAVRQARDFSLRTDLNGCDRDLILRLKLEAQQLPAYGSRLNAYDVYQFVIAGAGDSIAALEAWKGIG